jgi:hypothetical protein
VVADCERLNTGADRFHDAAAFVPPFFGSGTGTSPFAA